tara:strand:+ start:862 stop:1083 length:222 start_codon:yes stop_codon:yes gene_type:complete
MIFKNTRYKNKHHMATQLLLNTAGVTGHLDEEVLQVLYSAYKTTISRAYSHTQPLSFRAWRNCSLGKGIPVDE